MSRMSAPDQTPAKPGYVRQPRPETGCTRNTRCDECLNDLTFDNIARCTAWSSTKGHRCSRAATPGTVVCASHGSKAPQTRRKAQLRLAELVDPAIGTLAREMAKASKSSDRQRAANSILDRAGIGRQGSVEVDAARALLLERLLTMRTEAHRQRAEIETTSGVIDAEIVE